MKRLFKYVLLASSLLFALNSQAELFRVGPNDLPSPPGNGYPAWYQDANGLALDLCIPSALNQLDTCLLTPAPGDPLPTLPYSFPTNWPDEFFWYGADGLLDLPGGNKAVLVQAVEAAFGIGPAAIGDQISFARVRIVLGAPVDGNYTVTFPYGKEVFPNVKAGKRAIFFTSDIGIGAPGDFSGALKGAIGPFLTAVEADGVTPKPFFPVGNDLFLADPLVETQVTGSPFNTNYFEVCVEAPANFGVVNGIPTQCIRTDTFALTGKVHTGPIASAMNVARATYARNPVDANAQIDVFVSAEPTPFAAAPDLTVGAVGMASAKMAGPQAPGGQHYAQGHIGKTQLPSTVSVINSADTPPSAVVKDLVDEITILDASYDPATRTLSISAISSDTFTPPTLAAVGVPGSLTGSDTLSAAGTLSMVLPSDVPPKTVTVVSSAGGSATLPIMATATGSFVAGAPLAVDDNVATGEGVAAIFNILANDGAEAIAASTTLAAGTGPANGTAVNNLDGTVSYTPAAGYFGSDSFQYTVSNLAGLSSNTATVTIDVQQLNDVPVAVADSATVLGTTQVVTVNVAANDTDADGIAPAPGGLDPTSVASFAAVGGSTIDNGDGTVTFTKDINNCSAGCGFQYTIMDTATASSTAINTSNAAAVTISNVLANTPPTANADAASVIQALSVTINVAANDTNGTGTIVPGSVLVTQPAPGQGTVVNNGDGTVTYTAPATVGGPYNFSYTIGDDLGEVSAPATVSVTVNPAPDNLSVQRSECRAGKNEWRVDGSSSIHTAHTVTAYTGASVDTGTVITTVQVDGFGAWRMSKANTVFPCTSVISLESSLGGRLEGVFIPVN